MRRIIIWPTVATIVGFVVFVFLFQSTVHGGPERGIFMVFALMAAIPVGIFAAVFAAFHILRDDLASLRREVERLQKLEDLLPKKPTSTGIKPDPARPFPY